MILSYDIRRIFLRCYLYLYARYEYKGGVSGRSRNRLYKTVGDVRNLYWHNYRERGGHLSHRCKKYKGDL